MERLIYLLFYGENMLCPSSKLTVQLLMSIPTSKMANENTDALPMSLFWGFKVQLHCTAVKEGLTSVQWALVSVAIW